MGFGIISSTFTYVPRHLPAKPLSAPANVAASTDRTTIYISFDALVDGNNGGSQILAYNIYMDDGMDGDFVNVESQMDLTWNTASIGATLTTGNIYRLKYSATNVHGEGPLSDEVWILVAEIPAEPTSLTRIEMESLVAG